jgi:hypothetical protein
MSDPVLSQLVAVEDDLSQQVESLESKLTALQEQRNGLRTVIDMFQGASQPSNKKAASATGTAATASQPANGKSNGRKVGRKVGRKPGKKASSSAEEQSPRSESATATKPKATAQKSSANSKSVNSKVDAKPAQIKKKDGRAADWQKHVQADYQEAALPEAVSIVLRSQPSEVFTIADVMSSIFTEDMPRPSYLKARNRISNILSAGARDGTWYRGRNGRYSQSESVKRLK